MILIRVYAASVGIRATFVLEKMPPKRQGNQRRAAVDEIYGRDDLDRRIGQIVDERLNAVLERRLGGMIEQLTERMAAMMGDQHDVNPRRRENPNLNPDVDEAEDDLSSVDEEGFTELQRRHSRDRVVERD